MINHKILFRVIGSLLFIEAFLMLLCVGVSLYYHESDSTIFIISTIITTLSGLLLRLLGRHHDNTMKRKDSYLIVTLAWVIFSLFGTLPYLLGGYLTNFTDAFFENISGFTTTGATVIDDVEIIPHSILFWRSITQWIGGLGIVFFTIALLPSLVGGSVPVFSAEATGPFQTKLHPRLSSSAKGIWIVLLIITIACTLTYKILGMNWFDSINYAMTSTATGGFAVHNASILFYHSPAIEYACTFFCFISGINFTLLYFSASKLNIKLLFKNNEFRIYFFFILFFTSFITLQLILHNGYTVEKAFRSGVFQVVSFITTTGLFNDDAAVWPHVTWIILAICMFFGASSGSTSGGFKCIRVAILLKTVKNEIKQFLHPNAYIPLRVDGNDVSHQKLIRLLAFLVSYLILCFICAFAMVLMGVNNTNAVTITLSTIGNVGPTLGVEIGPTMSWSMLPDAAKWICSFLMLVGRLEIFTVLVVFTPSFWKQY